MNKLDWDLSFLYKNNNLFKKDLIVLENYYKKLLSFEGILSNKVNFFKFIDIEEKKTILKEKLSLYTIKIALDTTNLENQNLYEQLSQLSIKYAPKFSWVEQEHLSIGLETIIKWIKNTKYSINEHAYRSFFKQKEHILDQTTQKILSSVIQSRSTAGGLYTTLTLSDYKTPIVRDKEKEIILTQKKFNEILKYSHPIKDKKLRENSIIEFTKVYVDNKFSLAEIYKRILFEIKEDTIFEKYKTPLESELFSLQIPKDVFDTLLKISLKNSYLVREYNQITKQLLIKKLKIKKPNSSDSLLEIFKFDKKFKINQALEIIGNVSKLVSKEYWEMFQKAIEPGKIDYLEKKHKEKGAFSSGSIIYDPLILMNYDESIESVLTLAHEIGHSIHTLLSNKNQPIIYQGYPIYLAEIASFTLETLVLDYLIKNEKKNENKMHLISKKLDLYFSTFFRQAQFANFEHMCITNIFNNKIMNVEDFANLWIENSKNYGNDILPVFNKDLKYSWSRVSHFFYSPYYVYQYATCIVGSMKFVEQIKNGNPQDFIELLKSGSNDYPNNILLKNNIDLTKKEIYEPLFIEIKNLIKTLKGSKK